jgi:hypothetical protein
MICVMCAISTHGTIFSCSWSLDRRAIGDHIPEMESPPVSLQAIRAKKNDLLSTAAKYEAMAEKARKQAADFEAAERVWLQFSPEADNGVVRGPTTEEVRPITSMRTKPAGLPPVPDMIIEALTNATAAGAPGLTPSGLLSYVRGKYWPEAQTNDVGTTAWRMWKDGRLTKPGPDTSLYGLPKGNGSHPDLLEAGQDTRSQSQGETS